MITLRKVYFIFSLIAFLLIQVDLQDALSQDKISLSIGGHIPHIEVVSVEGIFASFYPPEGKFNLISFFSTEEIQSVELLKESIVLYRRFHEYGLEMIGVFTDETEESIINLAALWQLPWVLVQDVSVSGGRLTQTLGVTTTPFNLLINDRGEIFAIDLRGKEAHTTIAKTLKVSLDQIPIPEYPTPVAKKTRVSTPASTPEKKESPLMRILHQYGYPTYVDPLVLTEFEFTGRSSITVLQMNSDAQISLGWYEGNNEHVVFDSITGKTSPQAIDPGAGVKIGKFGLFIKVRNSKGSEGKEYQWYTDPQKNRKEKHARIYPMKQGNERIQSSYLIAWETNPTGMLDDDYQNLILRIDGVKPSTDRPEAAEAIEAITTYGGFLKYDDGGNVVEVNLVYGEDDTGQRVDCRETSDNVISYLPSLPEMKNLFIHDSQATDRVMKFIGQLVHLERLYMWGPQVSDEGVKHLANLQHLYDIHIGSSQITDKSLFVLSNLPKMERMALQQNKFTDEGLKHLAKMTQLKELWIGLGTGKITNEGVNYLANLINLEELELQRSQVTDAGILKLKGLKNLKRLLLDETSVTPTAAKQLEEAIPGIQIDLPQR